QTCVPSPRRGRKVGSAARLHGVARRGRPAGSNDDADRSARAIAPPGRTPISPPEVRRPLPPPKRQCGAASAILALASAPCRPPIYGDGGLARIAQSTGSFAAKGHRLSSYISSYQSVPLAI